MIDLADSSFLRSAFASKAVMSRELYTRLRDELRQKEFSEGQVELRRKKEQERAEDAENRQFEAVVLATIDEIESFGHRIDVYDTATVEALMQNEVELRTVRERIDQKLAQATVLPDGRRVFKTEDGRKVFDEFGKEVSSDEFTPDRIADRNPRFEGYWRDVETVGALTEEREHLHDFQNRMDDAREKAGHKGITAEELDELEKDIDAAAPERVRKFAADKLGLPEPVAKADPANDDLGLDERDIPAVPSRGGMTPSGGPSPYIPERRRRSLVRTTLICPVGTTTHRGNLMQDDELIPEEIHILYCLQILELSPQETAERVWLNDSPIMSDFCPISSPGYSTTTAGLWVGGELAHAKSRTPRENRLPIQGRRVPALTGLLPGHSSRINKGNGHELDNWGRIRAPSPWRKGKAGFAALHVQRDETSDPRRRDAGP